LPPKLTILPTLEGMNNTKAKGEVSEAIVLAHLLRAGK
jgi:hypothetical protein